MLKKLLRVFAKLMFALFVLFTAFVVYFFIAIRISEPAIADLAPIKKERIQYGSTFYKTGNNWLRKSESGLYELYVEGKGFERGAANCHIAK